MAQDGYPVGTLGTVAIGVITPMPFGRPEDLEDGLHSSDTVTDEELATSEDEDYWDLIDDGLQSSYKAPVASARGPSHPDYPRDYFRGRESAYPEHRYNVSREKPHQNSRTNIQHSKRRTSGSVLDEDAKQDRRHVACRTERRLAAGEIENILAEEELRRQRRREQRRVRNLAGKEAAANLQEEEMAAYKRPATSQARLEEISRLQDPARALRHQKRRERHAAALVETETLSAETQNAESQPRLQDTYSKIRRERLWQGHEHDGERSDEASLWPSRPQRSPVGPRLRFPIAGSKKSSGFRSWLHSLGAS